MRWFRLAAVLKPWDRWVGRARPAAQAAVSAERLAETDRTFPGARGPEAARGLSAFARGPRSPRPRRPRRPVP